MTKDDIISKLDLRPHPEGGYFKETYRSEDTFKMDNLNNKFSTSRNCSTCIYFLLTSENFSAFHRIIQDEIWHFYTGSPVRLHTINSTGLHTEYLIGNDLSQDQRPQIIVKGGDCFAAEVTAENSYSLVGCTVSPGFSFEDFELAKRGELIKLFPSHEKLITEFTRT